MDKIRALGFNNGLPYYYALFVCLQNETPDVLYFSQQIYQCLKLISGLSEASSPAMPSQEIR